jgi:glycosyltransferase involved in cell wall biosynthesis
MVVPPYFDVPPTAGGGLEAVVADLTDALVSRGHRVTLVGAGRPGTRARLVAVWDRTVPERLGEAYPEVMHAAASRRAVLRLARTEGLDVVHDHTFGGLLNAAVYADHGLPTVHTVHGPVDDDLGALYRAVGDDVGLVAVSRRQRQLTPDLNWIATVHNGLNVDSWPYRENKEGYALFLGRFHPDKAPHLALEAAHAAGVPLILAGRCAEPAEREYFERLVRPRLTAADHVFGVADAAAKRELLAGARCLLFPARWEEPFGLVLIEAMACGTPVVALRTGAVPEVVVDGVTGIVCDAPAELAPALRAITGLHPADCRRYVTVHFGSQRLGRGYETAYLTAAAGGEPADVLTRLRREYGALDAALDRFAHTRAILAHAEETEPDHDPSGSEPGA